MKKKIYAIILIILLLITGTIIGYKTAQSRNDMHIYRLQTSTDDSLIILENMRLVSCGSNLYVEPNFSIRRNSNINAQIEVLKLTITVGKYNIHNLTLTTDLNDKNGYISDSGYLLNNINIHKNSIVNVHFNYVIDGQTYDSSQDVILQQEL